MKNIVSLLFIFLIGINSLSAQKNKDTFAEEFNYANDIFSKVYKDGNDELLTQSKEEYLLVLPLFLDLYKQDTTNMNLAFKLGVCYHGARNNRDKAIPYFKKAITSVSSTYNGNYHYEKNAPLIAYRFLGDALHRDYQFDKAVEAYSEFVVLVKQSNKASKSLIEGANRKIEICATAKRLIENPVHVKIENLGEAINSSFPDYSPVLSADQNTLFFTTRRPESEGKEQDISGNYMEDIYISTKTKTGWSKAKSIGEPINTEWHEATVGVSPDAQTILIYKDDKGDGNIYLTTLEGNVWSVPEKLNNNINSKYWEPSAFMSADGNTIYFTSDRPGGFGGRDLYTCKKTPNGDWGTVSNMGPNINTPFDEDAPFIHPDGVSLTFSSNGHSTMGGFDIFTSLLSSDGNWSQPINAGYPINTTDDDVFYMVSPDGRTAYFSSFRENGYGGKDNYEATFPDRQQTPLTLIQGVVYNELGIPPKKVDIIVTDNETEDVVGVYHTNSNTGEFLFILTPGKNYNITYQAENQLFYSENIEIPKNSNYYELKREVALNPITVGSKITLNNIFFDFDKSTLRRLSNVELKNLVMLLKSNPNLKVEIAGHTDSKGDEKYNQALSEERAKAVVNKLAANGIDAARMKAKGYGKTMPIAHNKNTDGKDNPEGRQLNRRVELTITEIE